MRIRCGIDGHRQALSLRSIEVFVPTAVDSLKVKLVPLAESGHNMTTGVSERSVGSLCGDFVTAAGASTSLPFLDRVRGHGAAVGVNALGKKLMVTAGGFIHSLGPRAPARLAARTGDGGGIAAEAPGGGGFLSSADEAAAHLAACRGRGAPPQDRSVVAEAAMLLSERVAVGAVGMLTRSAGAARAPDDDGPPGGAAAAALGVHGLAFVSDTVCLRGWLARESARGSARGAAEGSTTEGPHGSFGVSLSSVSPYDDARYGLAVGSSGAAVAAAGGGGGGGVLPFLGRRGAYAEASVVVPISYSLRLIQNACVALDGRGMPRATLFARTQWTM